MEARRTGDSPSGVGLKRTLGLRNAVMMVVGNVVGAGIFTTSGFLAEQVASPIVFIGVWVVGGALTLCGALTYAELGATFPRAGGDYQFLKEAYGSLAGFLVGWLSFWVITPGSIAALSIALADHLPGMADGSIMTKSVAALVVICITGVNLRGTRLAGNTQDLVTIGSLVLLAGIVVAGAIWGEGNAENFSARAQGTGETLIGSALIAVIFTYSGWFASAYIGSEIRKPGRNVPLSLLIGTLTVSVLYAAVNCIYLYAMPLEEMGGVTDVAMLAADKMFSGSGTVVVSAAIVLAIASCINATVMTGARVCYAMASDKVFFKRLGAVHPRYNTPYVSLCVQGAIALVYIFAGTFEQLLSYVVFAMLIASIAAGVALFVLRVRRPELERPYKVFGFPVVPGLFVLAYLWIAATIAIEQPLTSAIGLGMVAGGVPFFFVWKTYMYKSGTQ